MTNKISNGMNKENNGLSAASQVREVIRSGRIKMRPKWQFILKAGLATSGLLFVLLAILYLASLIIFISRSSGAWFAPAFGINGIYIFLSHLPWLLVFLAVIFIIVLEFLASRYPLAYRQPLLYSALIIIVLSVLGGYALERTALHDRLLDFAENNRLPLAGPMYRQFNRQKYNDIQRGEISEIIDSGLIIKNRQGEFLNIVFTERTRLPRPADFKPGDFIVILGQRIGHDIRALGVSLAN